MRVVRALAWAGLLGREVVYAQNGPPVTGGSKEDFIKNLVDQMTVPEMVMQLYQLFADDVIGQYSDNALYDEALRLAPDAGIGVVHDFYTLNKSYVNGLQKLNLEKSRLKIPFIHFGECLHGVGSFSQSMFPQSIGMAASWDTDVIHRVGRAIATEARAIGIHACFAPVLDICQDPRWGRCQEDWGEDHILTSHLGVAYASGLSKNSTWNSQDAVAPVMKHFAAHGSPQSGLNAAPFMGHGLRQVLDTLLVPFKAAVDLAGVRGVMMAYSELDDVPCHVNPMLYEALDAWGYDGFVLADDTGMKELATSHYVADSPASAIMQWFNAGGMISFYDYPLETYMNATVELVANGSVAMTTLQEKARRILGVKYDLGLFDNPYIADDIDADAITKQHEPLALEAAHKSMVLLENRNSTLPLKCSSTENMKIALVGPYADIYNYGDYSGQFGAYPVDHASTIREGLLNNIEETNAPSSVATVWGANTWLYNAQNPVPTYLMSTANGTRGGLLATYYADLDFRQPLVQKIESPVRDWGLYPPDGLPSNNFSAVWEGYIESPVQMTTEGFLGVGVGPNTTARLLVEGQILVTVPLTKNGNLLSNIPSLDYSLYNSTSTPPGAGRFIFTPGTKYKVRLEFQGYNLYKKRENNNSLNSEVVFFWNLVDQKSPVEQAVSIARDSDVVVLALGANWNSDGENGDRGTLDLPANQTELAKAIYALNKPVVLVLEGGRPFAIPDFYGKSAAVLNTYFGGQSGGQAIADVLCGKFNPGGRLPLTIPKHVGQLPVYYNYKPTTYIASYVDTSSTPQYPFGHGMSYSNFTTTSFAASGSKGSQNFTATDNITFTAQIQNTGPVAGSYVPQVYLLQRVSQIVQPVLQLVAFTRVYLQPGESRTVEMVLDVERYLRILNRKYQWEVEKGPYTFALMENGGMLASTGMNVTLQSV